MLLEIKDLTREFVRRGVPFAAVDHVNLSMDGGEFIAIVGRSGNGKSTLLNMVSGLLRPTSGTVTVEGKTVAELDDKALSRLRNRTIGFVTQSQTLLPNLTVIDNVILPAVLFPDDPVTHDRDHAAEDATTPDASNQTVSEQNHSTDSDPDMPDVIAPAAAPSPNDEKSDALTIRAHALLADLQVDDLAQSYPRELSGGEMRRVSIARALMNQPKLLIADEPTGDLDAESTLIVMRLLRSLVDRGTSVLMVTHDADALPYADRILTLDAGRLAEKTA
ncbi:ABC transporter ATP-binding protein [Bifidobacterium tissieri]|uniref:ABC transporter ATP-binding protein n=1 Tax=Bifidobacterium tissieri TaxID=1630162 RepID=A0A5M9ZYW7_9BIFI|nr:ABC transporter ATP-binding protein [Bifidobacterium tissieri]KAA8830768.1 ABC transporter ATP-binding protein [Bifidobacterium tissieri]KAA8832780.1 ABC transporter ATP-binding protein [Bifidobacterium tissieri]